MSRSRRVGALGVGAGLALVVAFGAIWTLVESTDADPPMGWYAIGVPVLSGGFAALCWSAKRWRDGDALAAAITQAALTTVVYVLAEPILGVLPDYEQSTSELGERVLLLVLVLVPSVLFAVVGAGALRLGGRIVRGAQR